MTLMTCEYVCDENFMHDKLCWKTTVNSTRKYRPRSFTCPYICYTAHRCMYIQTHTLDIMKIDIHLHTYITCQLYEVCTYAITIYNYL